MAKVDAAEFWEERYLQGGDGWEIGRVHPSLEFLIGTAPPPRGRVAVPGCGRGHDVRFLVSHGYDAVGFDFAETAVAEARRLARAARIPVVIERRDIFTLARDYANAFDGVWEYTCYCAIDPRRRREYVRTVATILKPGGWFLASFFPIRRISGGPPFPVAMAEVRRLLSSWFTIGREFAPPRPVRRREGLEWMVLATRTGGPA